MAFYVYNVHLDHESQPSRERSVAMLLERTAAFRQTGITIPLIITGDFNAGEGNPAVQLIAGRMRDSFRAVHPAEQVVGTFNAFREDSTGEKIDYIFVSDAQPVSASIERPRTRAGRQLSDHFAVTAVVRFGTSP